jgi:hypothetical protein
MTNQQIINNFISGDTKGKVNNIRIEGEKLINYNTIIAVRRKNNIILNKDKYSVTTSKIQNIIRKSAYNITEITEQEIKNIA